MANWSLPTTSSDYVDVITYIDDRLDDVAKGMNGTAISNMPVDSIRWSPTGNKWEKWNGTAWNDLSTAYTITVTAANTLATSRTIALGGDLSGSTSFNGSANVTISSTLATTGVTAGSYGATTAVPVFGIDNKGRVTSATTVAIGSIATQSASNVAITGGNISGTNITLPFGTGSTTEGVVQWNTATDVLTVGTGAATKTFVDTNTSQSITNKTFGTGSVWNGGAVPVLYGGTGATDAVTARSNLGIGSIATQNADSVSISGGSISNTAITLVTGTGSTSEAVIQWNNTSDVLLVGTGAAIKTMVDTDSTQTLGGKTLTNPTINADSGVIVLPLNTTPGQTVNGSMVWDSDNFILTIGDGTGRKSLVDTTSTQTIGGKTLTTPTITLRTSTTQTSEGDIAWDATNDRITVGDGAATKLFYSKTENDTLYQIADAQLSAIAATSPAADTSVYFTDSTSATTMTVTSFARSILDDTSAGAVLTTIGAIAKSGDAFTGGIKEQKVAVAASDIDISAGNYFTKTITGTTTFTVSNVPSSGTVASILLDLTNGGAFTVNWWAGMKWAKGTAPTLSTSGRDVLAFYTHDAGTTWNGFLLGEAMA